MSKLRITVNAVVTVKGGDVALHKAQFHAIGDVDPASFGGFLCHLLHDAVEKSGRRYISSQLRVTYEFDTEIVEDGEAAEMAPSGGDTESDEAKGLKLLAIVRAFVEEQRITCPETIAQTDRVIENAYMFIEELVGVAGYMREDEED